MGYNTIVFLVETPILKRYYNRYGIEELRQQGFATTIYDLSPMILPIAYKTIINDLCNYEESGFKRIFSINEFSNALGLLNPKETLFICSMGYRWEYRKVFRVMKEKKFHFCYFMQELSPVDALTVNKGLKEKFKLDNLKSAATRRIPLRFHRVGRADFIIGCGGDDIAINAFKSIRLIEEDCPIFYFHSSNYEECLMSLSLERMISDRYCVFIDQYLPYHPDNIDAGLNLNPRQYYKEMNHLFEIIEKQYGIEVVIAAHPRSDYELHSGCYGNRKIYRNKTCRLVKDSEFVIYHFSNSFSYVAAFNKPVLVVTTKEIKRTFHDKIKNICQLLGTSHLDLDRLDKDNIIFEEITKRLKINETAYESYIVRYMKKNYTGVLEGERLWLQIGKFLASYPDKQNE